MPPTRRSLARMSEQMTCVICGNVIDVGQAWMEADHEGELVQAHSECLYREGNDPANAGWEPQEHSA